MELTFHTDDFAVFENFLHEDDLAAVWAAFGREPMWFVEAKKWSRIFKLADSVPVAGQPILSSLPIEMSADAASIYPSGRAIDSVVEAVSANAGHFARWVGTPEQDWTFFSCTPYVYPSGAGLPWHDDSQGRSASFVLYVHPEWKPSWGAELLIAANNDFDREDEGRADQILGHDQGFNDLRRMARLSESGFGFYVAPKPNRMVVIRSHVQHAIKKVDPSAGENVRASIAGFFQTPRAERNNSTPPG